MQKLSREHHSALVLSLRISKAATGAEVDDLMASVPRIFQAEMEPHFCDEESSLLPRLAAAGHGDLVARALAEHRRLRELVAAIARGDQESLQAFGGELNGHVRFEERELFPAAESSLPAEFLQNPS